MNESYRAKIAETGLADSVDEPVKSSLPPATIHLATQKAPIISDLRPRSDAFSAKPVRIAVKTKGKILLFSPGDILAVEAEGNYVLLQRESDSFLLRESISTMAEKLKAYGFIRIHRSVLVNTSWVEEIRPGATGEYVLRISNGKEYMVSRTYKNNLKLLAQSWIGTDSFVDQ